jgi:hypothetical protein
MSSSSMRRRVHLVCTDVSEERIASIFRVEISASEEPGDGILHSYRCDNLKSYSVSASPQTAILAHRVIHTVKPSLCLDLTFLQF